MRYRSTELFPEKISVIGHGCWSVASYNWTDGSINESIEAIHRSLEMGVNFFDVAPIYGYGDSEKILGKALAGKRDQAIIATKCGLLWSEKDGPAKNNLTYDSILAEVDASLLRLGVDVIDLIQMHWPDPDTPIEESMEAMKVLKQAGKIRYVGLSNFSLEEMKRASAVMPISAYQGLYNMLDRNSESYCDIPLAYRSEAEILPYCAAHGIAFIPYSPLSQGLLSGRYYKGRDKDLKDSDMRLTNPELVGDALDRRLIIVEQLRDIAQRYQLSLLELAMGWLIANPQITSIIAGSRTAKYAETSAACSDLDFSPELLAEIDAVLQS